jgi:DNA-binding MarR family transcriptional regulator
MKTGVLHRAFSKTARVHYKRTQSRLEKFGITAGQPRLLNYLFQHDGCIQHELAIQCDLKPATVSTILQGLEKAEMVFRLNDSADRRIQRVFLTEKGVQSQNKIDKVFNTLEKESFEDFTDQEKEFFLVMLDRLYFNLKHQME